jgi:hypothetical protein
VRVAAREGHCPVCVRTTERGVCLVHGPWLAHQLLTERDRERALRRAWDAAGPAPVACPRCLGAVAASMRGFVCVEHAHAPDEHGPFRRSELLSPALQREALRRRAALARAARPRRGATAVALAPQAAWAGRVLASAALVAATLAYLLR